MIYAKDKTYGIESKVLLIQRYLDEHLPDYWTGVTPHIYSVIQSTVKDGNTIAEVYLRKDEHRQIFFDDTRNCIIAFHVNSRSIKGSQHSAIVDVIFNVNIEKIHHNNLRETEKAIMQAYKVLKNSGYVYEITGIKETIKKVYSDFFTGNVNMNDMQPYFVFSITCGITYSEQL